MFRATATSQSSPVPPSLIAGDFPRVSRLVTVAAGAGVLPAGAVLGQVTATAKHVLSVAAAEDGSETLDVVLGESVDATAADATAVAYLTGEFHADALTFGAGHTASGARAALRRLSIFI